jgi:hypothetical protein
MAKLDTLNPAQPPDTEAVALGAQRMRQERDAIINSFATEHYLDGTHRLPQGVAAARPGAIAGQDGRIFIDTERETLEQQLANIWTILHAIHVVNAFAASAIPLSGAGFQDLASLAIVTTFGTKLLMVGQIDVNVPISAGSQTLILQHRFDVDGVTIVPTRSTVFNMSSGNNIPITSPIIMGIYDAGFGLTEGNHIVKYQVDGISTAGLTAVNRQLIAIAF